MIGRTPKVPVLLAVLFLVALGATFLALPPSGQAQYYGYGSNPYGYGYYDDGYYDDDWYYDYYDYGYGGYDDSYGYGGYDDSYDDYESAHWNWFGGYDDAGEEGLFDW